MNIVKVGTNYQVYGEGLQTFKHLPANTYNVEFNKMQGFFLSERPALEVKEEKVYGDHEQKVVKVLNAFEHFNRNLGVILSGQKGIGKSLFARMLSIGALKKDIPLLVVSEHFPGIGNFLNSIRQEVIVLFDEFEKTFSMRSDDGPSPQEELLPVFDGLDNGKKLFIVTCNDIHHLSDYLINRPGRFHYHFTISTPSAQEIREYLQDKLKKEYQGDIDKIVSFSRFTEITYDCLRAIAFELNNGYSLQDTLGDLNIIKTSTPEFNVSITLQDGTLVASRGEVAIDFFSTTPGRYWFRAIDGTDYTLRFNPKDAITSSDGRSISVHSNHISVFDEDNDKDVAINGITFIASNRLEKLRYVI